MTKNWIAATIALVWAALAGIAPASAADNPREKDWDQGAVQHLIPTASHDRFLIKASFTQPQVAAPAVPGAEIASSMPRR